MGKWNSETDKDKIPEIGYVSENNWGTDKESNIGNKIWKRKKNPGTENSQNHSLNCKPI